MTTKDIAYRAIRSLVEKFEAQIVNYKSADYNETQTRRDFIDPFFHALGWDVDNKAGTWEAYREVIHEDKIKIGGVTKAPDYCFRLLGGQRLFFVEAKKPSIVIKDDMAPAYQVRLYGWNAKLDISVVTDFEEFAIYDCSKKPKQNDKPSTARIGYYTYEDYLTNFDFFWDTFSREQVIKGGLIKYQKSDKKGTATVDKEFLNSLDEWRKLLAANIFKNNPDISEDDLNYSVQQTIDRIIFLRIAEDRGLEPYGHLKSVIKQANHYEELFRHFRTADDKYNSGLFHFKKEKENNAPEDRITGSLVIDNKTIKTIIESLYPPKNDYLFNVLPVEILGNAYEQFLGKQIVFHGNRATIEDKPEVRKAGGVYYTPQYIVDYIIEHTLGELIKGKTPKEISKIKIVDPACGSGSFLLGAYQYLLNSHLKYYAENNTKTGNKSPLSPEGNLTTAEKKRILINNIFGVDIDQNAVEVTKLSLLLKCMEGETQASINTQMAFFHDRVLPSLENNIKSGNSLIDLDFYDGELNFGEEKKVKPFNWEQQFPTVFKQGGFDVVVGNPPYVRQELLGDQKSYFMHKYKVYHGVADLYTYFIEKSIKLLKPKGLYGVIVANKWMRSNYGEPLRKWLKQQNVIQIIDFGDLPVFQSATTYPCILICSNNKPSKEIDVTNVKSLEFDNLNQYVQENNLVLEQRKLEDNNWNLISNKEKEVLNKICSAGVTLDKYVSGEIYYGIKTGLNEAFVIDKETKDQLIKEDEKSAEIIKPFLAGRDIKRYQKPKSDKYLIFIRRGIEINNYPAVKNYLFQYKKQLMPKPKDYSGNIWEGRKSGNYKWYEIQDAVDYYAEFEKPKIMIPAIVKSASYTFDNSGFYSNDKTSIIPSEDFYLLGILNSKACDFYLKSIAATKQNGYFEYKPMYVSKLPIPDSSGAIRDEIIENVKLIMALNDNLQNATPNKTQEQLQERIKYTNSKIDQMVYQLYHLTEDEIKIIEENT